MQTNFENKSKMHRVIKISHLSLLHSLPFVRRCCLSSGLILCVVFILHLLRRADERSVYASMLMIALARRAAQRCPRDDRLRRSGTKAKKCAEIAFCSAHPFLCLLSPHRLRRADGQLMLPRSRARDSETFVTSPLQRYDFQQERSRSRCMGPTHLRQKKVSCGDALRLHIGKTGERLRIER